MKGSFAEFSKLPPGSKEDFLSVFIYACNNCHLLQSSGRRALVLGAPGIGSVHSILTLVLLGFPSRMLDICLKPALTKYLPH